MDDLSYLEDRIGQLFYHYSIGSIRVSFRCLFLEPFPGRSVSLT